MKDYKTKTYKVTLKNEDWEIIEQFANEDGCSVHQEMSNLVWMGLQQLKSILEERMDNDDI